MSAPTVGALAEPAVIYACPCCLELACTCGGHQVTGSLCTCCATPELVTNGSQRGKHLPCSCGALAYPAAQPVIWCDGHAALAVYDVHWIDPTDPRDPRGASTPVCADPACLARVLADVEQHGDLQQVTPC